MRRYSHNLAVEGQEHMLGGWKGMLKEIQWGRSPRRWDSQCQEKVIWHRGIYFPMTEREGQQKWRHAEKLQGEMLSHSGWRCSYFFCEVLVSGTGSQKSLERHQKPQPDLWAPQFWDFLQLQMQSGCGHQEPDLKLDQGWTCRSSGKKWHLWRKTGFWQVWDFLAQLKVTLDFLLFPKGMQNWWMYYHTILTQRNQQWSWNPFFLFWGGMSSLFWMQKWKA